MHTYTYIFISAYNEINGLRIIVADEYKYLNEVRDRFNLYMRCADDLGLEIDFIR